MLWALLVPNYCALKVEGRNAEGHAPPKCSEPQGLSFLVLQTAKTKTVNAALLVAKLHIAVKILAVKLYFHVY